MSKTLLRVLNIEDTPIDAELLEAHLSLREFELVLKRVETPEDLKLALQTESWDIVLADYSLPHMNAIIALKLIQDSGQDLPVIVVSGTIGESRAIEMMRAGANDFVVKGDFTRLIPAIRRELGEAANRRARRQAEAALAVSEASFKKLADAMPQLVWTANVDGQMTYANQRFYDYTGMQAENLLGLSWRTIIRPPESVNQYLQNIRLGQEITLEHQLRAANGEYRWYLTRAIPARDEQQKITEWYATSTDIHEQKMVAAELEEAKVLAEQANEAKSAFLANMSHEIRTPLGAILGFAELMEYPEQPESERLECIAAIRRNGGLLSKVINEILDLSKIESRKLEIDVIEFDLPEVMEDIRLLMDFNAKGKGLVLKFKDEGFIPRKVISDPTRLRQILINVIGNAVKFTERGFVQIVSSFQPDGKSGKLSFRVEDTGVGISNEQAARLFQPFVQADNSMTRRFGGTGLGLSLSRKLAQAMGGDVILADSKMGSGSTFLCSIQVNLAD